MTLEDRPPAQLISLSLFAATFEILIFGGLRYLIPEISQQYSDSGMAIPSITRLAIEMSDILVQYGFVSLVVLAILVALQSLP